MVEQAAVVPHCATCRCVSRKMPLGECPYCGDDHPVRRDGTMRRHRDYDEGTRDFWCPGSLHPPRRLVANQDARP